MPTGRTRAYATSRRDRSIVPVVDHASGSRPRISIQTGSGMVADPVWIPIRRWVTCASAARCDRLARGRARGVRPDAGRCSATDIANDEGSTRSQRRGLDLAPTPARHHGAVLARGAPCARRSGASVAGGARNPRRWCSQLARASRRRARRVPRRARRDAALGRHQVVAVSAHATRPGEPHVGSRLASYRVATTVAPSWSAGSRRRPPPMAWRWAAQARVRRAGGGTGMDPALRVVTSARSIRAQARSTTWVRSRISSRARRSRSRAG